MVDYYRQPTPTLKRELVQKFRAIIYLNPILSETLLYDKTKYNFYQEVRLWSRFLKAVDTRIKVAGISDLGIFTKKRSRKFIEWVKKTCDTIPPEEIRYGEALGINVFLYRHSRRY